MVSVRQGLQYAGIAVVALVVLLVVAFLLGIIGVPTVEGVENRFGSVNSTDTVVETDLAVNNPNPIGITLGGTTVNYTVFMNEVSMANGRKAGLSLGSGTSTLDFTTYLQNQRIPDWWYTHVDRGEVTEVLIDADLSVGLLFGQTFDFETNQPIETDILGGFNTSETRPIDVGAPGVADPALYLNRTAGWYGENLTRTQTPIETAFTVYNPKPYPYTVTEIGYEIRMNDVTVGTGTTGQPYAVPPQTTTTLRATTILENEQLDDWWVSHLRNDQVTDLTIDFHVLVQPEIAGQTIGPVRVDVDAFDYTTTIETDMFGNKADDGGNANGAGTGSADGADGAGSDGSAGSDGGSDDETATRTATPTSTATPSPTPTEDDGILGALLTPLAWR